MATAASVDSPVKYIKLGKQGVWERECLLQKNTLRLGFIESDHKRCLAGDWDGVHQDWIDEGNSRGVATSYTNQITTFYTAGNEILWVTFHARRMWWCRAAHGPITRLPSYDKERAVDGKWSCQSESGQVLSFSRLRKSLTRTRLFKGTICNVADPAYVLATIFGPSYTSPEEVSSGQTYTEGAVQTVTVNRYERDRRARLRCIEEYGWDCAACGCSMKDLYGKVADGLIHVHHLTELSSIKQEYQLDPIKDLRPVCPNCHAVLHTQSPALSIEELRGLLAKRKRIKWPRR